MALAQPLMSASDPYHTFSDALTNKIARLRIEIEDWRTMLESVNTAESVAFQTKDKAVKEGVSSTRKDLEFVKRTVMAVESGRARFAHVDDAELGARKDFVKARERELDELAAVVSGPEATEKKAADREVTERKRREREVASGVSAESAYARAHDASIAEHRAQQQELMRKQDEDLSAIEGSVVRLGEMAKVINVELGDQERMLDDLDKEVDVAQSNLDRAIGAIQKLLKSKDNCQLITIVVLIIVLLAVAVVAFT